jgi:hypothetical protein
MDWKCGSSGEAPALQVPVCQKQQQQQQKLNAMEYLIKIKRTSNIFIAFCHVMTKTVKVNWKRKFREELQGNANRISFIFITRMPMGIGYRHLTMSLIKEENAQMSSHV